MQLVYPAWEHKTEVMAYRQEFINCGETYINGSNGLMGAKSYESWLEEITLLRSQASEGWVTSSIYFAIVSGRIIGTIALRHYLNDELLQSGGHIGYAIRPLERRKGFATQMLGLVLEKCRAMGIAKALVTCDKDNIASAKTIINNGGVLADEFVNDVDVIEQRYWITIL